MFRCRKCDGLINCPWLKPHDEANCSQCPSHIPHRCDCNKPENFTCKGYGRTCYSDHGKIFAYHLNLCDSKEIYVENKSLFTNKQ